MPPTYFAERTIQYKTYIKTVMVEGLRVVFNAHPDTLLNDTNVSLEYPRTRSKYPAVIVRFYERSLSSAGISHMESIRKDFPVGLEAASTKVPGAVAPGTYTYRIAAMMNGVETLASNTEEITFDLNSEVTLTWPAVANATSYRIYRRGLRGRHTLFTSTTPTFVDTGAVGTDGSPYIYYPARHLYWTGDIELAIYALSSYDRDLISDTLVQTLMMADMSDFTNALSSRVWSPSTVLDPAAELNFVNLNTDKLQPYGETQAPVPWGAEDDQSYQTAYRIGASGEVYSLPDNAYHVVEEITTYPYEQCVDPLPLGDPAKEGIWHGSGPRTQLEADEICEAEDAKVNPYY